MGAALASLREAVTAVVAELAVAPDAGDWDRYGDCFADEVEVTNPHFMGGTRRFTRQEWIQRVATHQSTLMRFHLIGPPRVVDGPPGQARAWAPQHVRFQAARGAGRHYEVGGELQLHLVAHDACWLITQLAFDVRWWQGDRGVLGVMST